MKNRDTSTGTWPNFRHDSTLRGFQALPGNIIRPRIAWQYYLGGPLFDARVFDSAEGACLLLPFGGCLHCYNAATGALQWKSLPRGYESIVAVEDVDRDGRTEIIASNGKSVFVLNAANGEILWHEYLGPPYAGGFMHTGALLHHFPEVGSGMQLAIGLLSSKEVAFYDFTPGAACPDRLPSFWMDDFFHPTLLAVDIDNDGHDELVITKYSSIYIVDPATGNQKTTCTWESGGSAKRNYGLFQAIDLDGNGSLDLVVLSHLVSRHIAVIRNAAGALSDGWDRFIEHIYPDDEKELRYTSNSCIDIDGDGRYEIVFSTYNDSGDKRWWLEVVDALTGAPRVCLPDCYLLGIQPIAGKPPVLLVSLQYHRQPREAATVQALQWGRGEGVPVHVWESENADVVGCFSPLVPDSRRFRSDLPPSEEVCSIVDNGQTAFVLKRPEGLVLVYPELNWRQQAIPGTTNVVSMLVASDMNSDGKTEFIVSDAGGGVRSIQADGTEVFHIRKTGMRLRPGAGPYYMARPMQAPVIFSEDDKRYCAIPDAGTMIHLLHLDSNAGAPILVWNREGRGRMGPEEAFHCVSTGIWDGKTVILLSKLGDDGGKVEAYDCDGNCVAQWRAPSVSGSATTPLGGRSGVYEFALFRVGNEPYLVISAFRSHSMNSEYMACLDSESNVIWDSGTIAGKEDVAVAPWNAWSVTENNGATLHFLAKDTVVELDVATGTLRTPVWKLRTHNTSALNRLGLSMDDFSAYGVLVPIDIDNDREEEQLILANYGGFGLLNVDNSVRWWNAAPLSSLTGSIAGIGDVDGDGVMEIGLSHADGNFVCSNGNTGEERWRLNLGEVATDVCTCDIDGDGNIEFVLGTREGSLLAIGVATTGVGVIKWKRHFGYSLGPLAIGDIDGDGVSEILSVSGDGNLYAVKGKR